MSSKKRKAAEAAVESVDLTKLTVGDLTNNKLAICVKNPADREHATVKLPVTPGGRWRCTCYLHNINVAIGDAGGQFIPCMHVLKVHIKIKEEFGVDLKDF